LLHIWAYLPVTLTPKVLTATVISILKVPGITHAMCPCPPGRLISFFFMMLTWSMEIPTTL
jgi:hypothetical protein